MRTLLILATAVMSGLVAAPAGAASFTPFDQFVFLHIGAGGGGASPLVFDATSGGYTEALDADGYGSYGWRIANTTATTWADVSLIFYLDADFGPGGYSNETADFVGLDLPGGVPADAIAPDQWEIDEPGWVFGDIYDNAAYLGALDNGNGLPPGQGEDVALALGWTLPALAPGDEVWLTMHHVTAATTGLAQFDPAGPDAAYVWGFARVIPADPDPDPDPPGVPEPSALVLGGLGALAMARRARSSAREVRQ